MARFVADETASVSRLPVVGSHTIGTPGVYAPSGADMIATITLRLGEETRRYVFGELMTLTYSVHRELVPVRTLGFADPRGYVRGPRTVGGTLVFAVFDVPTLKAVRDDLVAFYRKVAAQYGLIAPDVAAGLVPLGRLLADEMPPFDIHVTFYSDYPDRISSLVVRGVQIVNEGQVMSIEDVMTERTLQYVALDVRPDLSPLRPSALEGAPEPTEPTSEEIGPQSVS